MNYRIQYEAKGANKEVSFDVKGPIDALNAFHKYAQVDQQLDRNEYKYLTLAKVYSCNGTQIESFYDLPNTSNPDLSEDAAAERARRAAKGKC